MPLASMRTSEKHIVTSNWLQQPLAWLRYFWPWDKEPTEVACDNIQPSC